MSKVNDSSLWNNDNAADGDVVDQTAWNQNMQVFKAAINDNQNQINQITGSQTTQVVATGTSYPTTPGTGQMFYRTDTKEMMVYDGTSWVADSAGESLVQNNGYITHPSGVIYQWCYVNNQASGYAQSFPIAFPNACFGLQATVDGSVPGAGAVPGAKVNNNQGFTWMPSATCSGWVWAVGY